MIFKLDPPLTMGDFFNNDIFIIKDKKI